MHFQYISDLHLEFVKPKLCNIKNILIPSAPYLAILGDLSNPYNKNFGEFFNYYSPLFKNIFYVSGNHEYYYKKTFEEIETHIQFICSKYPNVHYLNNKTIQIENIIILGTTLWSNTLNNLHIKYYLNDYIKIYSTRDTEDTEDTEDKKLINVTPKFTTSLHLHSVEWLNSELEKYKDQIIIVLTHHLPSFKLIHPKYAECEYNDGFVSDLDYIFEKNNNIKYWLCGHTHTQINICINQTICLTNPCGYPGETQYNKQACIDI